LLQTPASGADAVPDLPIGDPEAEDGNALLGTLSQDSLATPLSTLKLPRFRSWLAGWPWGRGGVVALLVAAGIILGGLVLVGWLVFG
jgi:hypothetical protein